MVIKRLYIGDFGIFRNQALEDLHPGLVVVGGRNRAGKSTLREILTHLGYGFSKGGQLPPPHVRYQVEADVVRDEGKGVCHIRLEGQSDPVFVGSAEASAGESVILGKDIYPVDAFTYRNLFSVSLDRLTRVPEGMNNREALQLHSILLGAGLSDFAGIPQLENKFRKEATSIGGLTGSPTNKGFQPYMRQIKAGMEQKKQALARVEEYRIEQSNLSAMEKQLAHLQNERKLRQANLDVLEMLKGNYDVFAEIGQAAAAMDRQAGSSVSVDFPLHNQNAVQTHYQRYGELDSCWREQYARFRGSLEEGQSPERLIPLLRKNRSTLERLHEGLSGLRERLHHCGGLSAKISEEKDLLLSRMKRLNPAWTEKDLDRIRDLPLELLEESALTDAVSHLRQARDRLRQLEYRKEEIHSETERLKQQKADWQAPSPAARLKTYIGAFAVSAVLGIVVYRFHPAAGLFLGLFGIAGAALSVFLKSLGQKEAGIKQRELDSLLSGYAGQLADLDDKIRLQRQEQDAGEEVLSSAREKLGLAESVGPDGVPEYYRASADLQDRIGRFSRDREEWEELSGKLDAEWTEIRRVVEELEDCRQNGPDACRGENSESLSVDDRGIETAPCRRANGKLNDPNCPDPLISDSFGEPDHRGHAFPRLMYDPDRWQALIADLVKWYDRMKAAMDLDSLYREKKSTKEILLRLVRGEEREKLPDTEDFGDIRPEIPESGADRANIPEPSGLCSDRICPTQSLKLPEALKPLESPEQPELYTDRINSPEPPESLEDAVEAYLSVCRSRTEFLALQQRMDVLVRSLERAAATDRLQTAVSLLRSRDTEEVPPDRLHFFFARYEQYPSREALDGEYGKASSEVREWEDRIENCREEVQKARNNLESLALTSELEQAHDRIQQGRAGLTPVAREYAVRKAAAWLCRDIRNRFLEDMREELLRNADGILRELTSEAYGKLTPGDDLKKPDFSLTLADGSTQDSTDVLSRGTREQVFLAVRLGRIMEIRPALPVIIDDTLVNFDPPHLERAVSVLSRLSRTHQIFLLTCHPHLISLFMKTKEECQYWRLDNGRFSETDGASLMEYL